MSGSTSKANNAWVPLKIVFLQVGLKALVVGQTPCIRLTMRKGTICAIPKVGDLGYRPDRPTNENRTRASPTESHNAANISHSEQGTPYSSSRFALGSPIACERINRNQTAGTATRNTWQDETSFCFYLRWSPRIFCNTWLLLLGLTHWQEADYVH